MYSQDCYLPLTATQISISAKFHISNLRRFQSLLQELQLVLFTFSWVLFRSKQKNIASLELLFNILTTNNTTIRDLSTRQIAIDIDKSKNYFSRVQEILDIYQLPHIRELKLSNLTIKQWKIQIKNAVNKYWTEHLQSETREKSTLKYLNIDSLKIGSTHLVWSSFESTVSEFRMGITKCWMLTGTNLLQTNKY